jgi:hypothetical protein
VAPPKGTRVMVEIRALGKVTNPIAAP